MKRLEPEVSAVILAKLSRGEGCEDLDQHLRLLTHDLRTRIGHGFAPSASRIRR
jgi:hypothetical protein